MKNNLTIWFLLIVFALPFSAFALYTLYKNTRPLPVYGSVKGDPDHRVGAFSLIDQDGKQADGGAWKDRIVVVDFFFTSCATICPDLTRNLRKVSEQFKGDDDVRIASFSVDPESDSASVLKEYAGRYGISDARWQLLTGDKKQIYLLARNGFKVVATEGDGDAGDFIHTEKFILLDREQRIRGYYDGTSDKDVNKLIRDIKKLRNEK
jgi:protein SCO1/2